MTAPYGQLAARLWDVAPDGTAALVTRGVYRLTANQHGAIAFQLFGGGYRFRAGHTAKLELLGNDAPFVQPSRQRFSVTVDRVRVALPTRERQPLGARRRAGR
jgi:predicted acyl esterase